MWEGAYRVIDLRGGCAERSAKGDDAVGKA